MDARFRSNLEMIGRNEPITKKAKFWQSYVRALKGTDDMRAPEHTHRPRGIFRSDFPELHSWNPYGKSIYEDPLHAADRINTPGYRYLPVHREIYGYTPRQIYPHQYKPVERYIPARPYDPKRAWDDHLGRLGNLDVLSSAKALSRGPIISSPYLSRKSLPLTTKPIFDLHGNILDTHEVLPLFPMSVIRGTSPLKSMLNPSIRAPISSFTRDPFWYPSLAPYIPSYAQRTAPFFLRDSYLSPIKRNYLWSRHPLRPFVSDPTTGYQYYSQPVPVYHFTSPWYNRH